MLLYVLLFLILAFSLLALIFAASLIVGLVVTGGVPFISTPRREFDAILQAAELKPGEKIYDLGCGKAHLLVNACKKFPVEGVGYELALWPYLWARINSLLSNAKVKVYCRNFFKADLSQADVVFCYLFPEIMAKLEPKFRQELKPDSRVVSYAFKLPNMAPEKVVTSIGDSPELGKIYLYRF